MSGKIEENACASCPVHRSDALVKLGVDMGRWDFAVALAGNPNTGKSTVFNNLTGLRQHTGNWPGKTISRAEGGFSYGEANYKLVDLPGTYSLLSTSYDEEIARDFILFGRPDVTVIVVDATRLERNLNLVLQVLEIGPVPLAACPSARPIARLDRGLEPSFGESFQGHGCVLACIHGPEIGERQAPSIAAGLADPRDEKP